MVALNQTGTGNGPQGNHSSMQTGPTWNQTIISMEVMKTGCIFWGRATPWIAHGMTSMPMMIYHLIHMSWRSQNRQHFSCWAQVCWGFGEGAGEGAKDFRVQLERRVNSVSGRVFLLPKKGGKDGEG